MRFIGVEQGHFNPRTVEIIRIESKQYSMHDFERNDDGTPVMIGGMPVYKGYSEYFEYVTVQAVLTSGTSVVLESWDTRRDPDIVRQERLDYWLHTIEEALG